jgi:TM2 domain-containing membrane protein YozV
MEKTGRTINWLPALASFIIPGLGQLMQGRFAWAAVWIVLGVVVWFLFILGPLVHVLAAAEAAIWNPSQKV